MKPEELLYSMDHVGEDLLTEAEQTILVRKRRPWLGAAVAAVLVLAVGVGGFLLLKKHLPGKTPAQPGNSDTVATSEPEDALPISSNLYQSWWGKISFVIPLSLRQNSQ